MELSTNSPFFINSEFDRCDLSTGYLEDALVGFSIRFKRRKLDSPCFSFDDGEAYTRSLAYATDEFSDCSLLNELAAAAALGGEKKSEFCQEEGPVSDATAALESSSSSYSSSKVDFDITTKPETSCFSTGTSSVQGKEGKKMEKEITIATACPFGMVKSGGIDGGATLKDINKRLLRTPTRPVRHPVGDYASRPWVTPNGPGLSGKAVVALTRIHTQGSGTITIIRTKG